MHTATEAWYPIADPDGLPTPSLCFYTSRIEANIAEALRIAGRPERLRPHVKTCKSPDVVAMLLRAGVSRFKCATLAEAEMLAQAGARDVLVAYPLIGPNVTAFTALCRTYPGVRFYPTVDSPDAVQALEAAAAAASLTLETAVDLNVGMNRTGVAPGQPSEALYRMIADKPHLAPGGIHAYDGHVQDRDFDARRASAAITVAALRELRSVLESEGLAVPRIVAGGTPTFPCHAEIPEFELSPGTCFLHDGGYLEQHPDLQFLPAALIVGRVVSKPSAGLITVDIGSKAIATDAAGPRGTILNLPESKPVGQSEEHWVFRLPSSGTAPRIGDLMYVLPRHICPSVEHYDYAAAVDDDGRVSARWPITARGRELSFM